MPNLPSQPDFLLDRTLAEVTTNKLITDAQIDELVEMCDPPSAQLRDYIAVEFERAALVLLSGRAVGENRAKRRAFQVQLCAAQRHARKIGDILSNVDPELKTELNGKFKAAQKNCDSPVALPDIKHLLDAFVDIDLLYPAGTKSEDVLIWVIDGMIHAIETRLVPAFNCYGSPKKGKWFSKTKQAKLIFALLKIVEPEKCVRYNLDYISHRIKRSNRTTSLSAD